MKRTATVRTTHDDAELVAAALRPSSAAAAPRSGPSTSASASAKTAARPSVTASASGSGERYSKQRRATVPSGASPSTRDA